MKGYKGDLKKLLTGWELEDKDVWVDYQVLGPMFAALRIFWGMKDILPVIVGQKGCLYHLRFTVLAWGEEDFDMGKRPLPLLEYSKIDIIRGDYALQEGWIQKMQWLTSLYDPKLIVLIPTDSLQISGAHMPAIAEDVSRALSIPCSYADVSGISGANQWKGYDAALRALYRPLLQRDWEKRDSVNLVGWMWPSRRREHEIGACVDILAQLNIEVEAVVTGGSSLQEIEKSMRARANALVCSALAGDMLFELEEKAGIQLAGRRAPYGFSGTREWLKGITEALDLNRDREIDVLEGLYAPDFLANKERLKGKKVFVSGGPGRLIGLLHLLLDYEMDIEVAALFWPHPWSRGDLQHMLEQHNLDLQTFIVSPGLDDLEDMAFCHDFDLWLGGYQEQHTCRRHGIPFVPITVYTSPHVGFEGTVNLGNKLVLALDGFDFTESSLKAKEIKPCIRHLPKKSD